jgi:hypothetical protein
MPKVKDLYNAIIKPQKDEDRCTNFLLLLLNKLPSDIILRICDMSDLNILHKAGSAISIESQYMLKNSIPDGIIELSEQKYIIIETKIYPDYFNREQFMNHLEGSIEEFGKENIWLIFLSGDEHIPKELENIRKIHPGRVGFISWKSILYLFESNKSSLGEKYELIIEEFLSFANHYKLGRLISMNNEELNKFIESYSTLIKYQKYVKENFTDILNQINDRILMECEERVEVNRDVKQEELPCICKGLKIKGWHTEYSGYLFINLLLKKIGIMLVGYQDKKERTKFLSLWNDKWKNIYKDTTDLCSFTWIDEDEDEYAINGGYFKIIEGSSGKLFNPTIMSETDSLFYWGYAYELEIEKIKSYIEIIPKDFKKLLDTFIKK